MKLVENHNQTIFVKENLFWVVVVHLAALGLGPFYFSWDAWWFAVATMFLFGYSTMRTSTTSM